MYVTDGMRSRTVPVKLPNKILNALKVKLSLFLDFGEYTNFTNRLTFYAKIISLFPGFKPPTFGLPC